MNAQDNAADQVGDCKLCGRHPALICIFQSVEGRIIYYNKREYVGRLCASCMKRAYAGYSLDTLLWGWWSIYGFLRTPCIVVLNTVEVLSCLVKIWRLAKPMRGSKE